MSGTRFYKIWAHIKQRSLNPNADNYDRYGGRGIKLAYEWSESFEIFYSQMYRSYLEHCAEHTAERTSIDRIDVNGHYVPGNTRWSTPEVQARNRRVHKDSKSGVTGVTWNRFVNRWISGIKVDGRQINLGSFTDVQDAIQVRKDAEDKYFKDVV